ncbi:BRCA1-associated protein 2-domain-containing protein [Blyttiomyces helicus]|uniref:BRCA1-associated protein 2-domain-containing protein n=1 Tax=Blyttiomyces helicus TaxID=388810 RepID=A0A4P9WBT5_9FUNG|nr:BRCA1-associated protein 2-domain-containing protein [Blyttiomyces helicus]|eukprot:RKO89033.1 BRCA1-associated protein 2-domain-containing protein [Blyttiomyces helicus]
MYHYHLRFEFLPPATQQTTTSDLAASTDPKPPPYPTDIFLPLAPSYRCDPTPSPRRRKAKTGKGTKGADGSGAVKEQGGPRVEKAAGLHTPDVASRRRRLPDWRIGPLSIEWWDMNEDPPVSTSAGDGNSKVTATGATKPRHIVPTSGAFVPFRAGKTELNAGILHLYRDREEVLDILSQDAIPLDEDASGHPTSSALASAQGTGTVLCVLAVPTYMSAQDFLNFVAPVRRTIAHLRIVRDSIPNRYMVLVKCRTRAGADAFYEQFNGRGFSSLEPEIAHVVYLKSVDSATPAIRSPSATSPATAPEPHPDRPHHLSPTIQLSPPLLELPTCPVCLDRMDASVTGLLTILCHHTFHCHCLSRWGDGTCPVCRYSQRPVDADAEGEQNECADCGAVENLWICLVCGNVGCGRYRAKHAHAHFEETSHLYAMELETQRVWDYAGDGYVHRLIQNRADGKLVELPAPGGDGDDSNGGHPDGGRDTAGTGGSRRPRSTMPAMGSHPDKLEAIGLEYSYLLTSQLESQRLWYESRLATLESDASARIASLESEAARAREYAADRERLAGEVVPRLQKEKRSLERRIEKLMERADRLEREAREEREINTALRQNQETWRARIDAGEAAIKAKEAAVVDLQEQVRDLMFFLETQKVVEGSGELQGGSVVGVAAAPAPPASRRKGKGKK